MGSSMPFNSLLALSEEIDALASRDEKAPAARRLENIVEENALLHAVIDNFPGGLSLVDKNLKLVFCNKTLRDMLDYPQSLFAFGTPSLEQLFRFNATRGEYGPGQIEDHVVARMELVRQRCAHTYQRVRPNGMVLEIRGVPLEGGGFMTTYLDITQSRQIAQADARQELDQLTGLPKAAYINEQIELVLAGLRPGQVVALHCLDLDHFKSINKHYGRSGGDHILRELGTRLKGLLRGNDPVARIGGDRFLVLQRDVKRPSDVARLANRIMLETSRSIQLGSEIVSISSSIGFALAPRDGDAAHQLLDKVQTAVIATKQRNRGGFDASATEWHGQLLEQQPEE